MLDQQQNAKRALIAKLQQCIAQLPNATADEIFAQTEALKTLVRAAATQVQTEPAEPAGHPENQQITHLFADYSRALSQSQGRVSRALGVLGFESPVYSESEHANRGPLPVTGVRPTSVTA